MLGSPILYFKGTRIMMFQLSGFYYRRLNNWVVVKIRAPFWVPRILGAALYEGPQNGTLFLTTTQLYFLGIP